MARHILAHRAKHQAKKKALKKRHRKARIHKAPPPNPFAMP